MNVQGVISPDLGPLPLASDESLWAQVVSRVRQHSEMCARGLSEPVPTALSATCSLIRSGGEHAEPLRALLRRLLARTEIGSEVALRCLRVIARSGEMVDLDRLSAALQLAGRPPRIALMGIAELAARGHEAATNVLVRELQGGLRNEAAHLLSCIASETAVDALAKHLRTPGITGIHAASALVATEEDPFAFEMLCERLCEPEDSLVAARALWQAGANGVRLVAAEAALARWARRGVTAAERGQWMAAAYLTAGKVAHDVSATLRALHSEDDDVVLLGAQAAYNIGDAEHARGALLGLFRRGPTLATQAFQVLARWADLGDSRAYVMLRNLLERRPIDLSRSAIFDALSTTQRPALRQVVARGIMSADRMNSLEACRSLSRLREPPAVVPALWM